MKTGPRKPLPKYLQLKESLIRYLIDEQYTANQKLPTENELIEQFRASRGTIRQALAELEHDGMVYKIQGSGSFFSGNMSAESQPSHLIGVIAPTLSSYIYPQIIQGVTDMAQQHHYNVVVGASETNPKHELGCIEQLLAKDIDGLILAPASGFQYAPETKLLTILKTLTIPVVFMGSIVPDPDLSYVALDDVAGGFKATNYLIAAGHRRIACCYPPYLLSGQYRHQGYRDALQAAGIAPDSRIEKLVTSFYSEETPRQMKRLVQELLECESERPTAIFFFNDVLAVHGYAAIETGGLRVPEDVSIISFDDSDLALRTRVPLTSMVHPKHNLGRWTAELLFDKIIHQEYRFPRHLIITPPLTVRDSVKTLKR